MERLDKLIREAQKEFGTGTIMDLRKNASIPGVERIKVDSPKIGNALGNGGFPKGRIIEIYGPESGGKTSFSEYLAGQFQKEDFEYLTEKGEKKIRKGVVLFIDAEHSIDLEYAQVQGFMMSQAILVQPDNGEQAFDIAIKFAESGEVDLIVIDSIAAMTPLAEINANMDQQQMGLQARLIAKGLRKLNSIMSVNKCSLIAINQIRDKIGVMYGPTTTTPGGHALKFYSSIRIELRKREYIIGSDNETIGLRIAMKIVKNKTAPPMIKELLDMYFDRGFDATLEWIDFAIKYDLVKKSGAWFMLFNKEEKVHGKNSVIEYYSKEENKEEYNKLIEETRKVAFPDKKNLRISVDSKEEKEVVEELLLSEDNQEEDIETEETEEEKSE
jgi:recombination protein RecA